MAMIMLIYWVFLLFKRWVRFGKELEFLDSPGIIPMRISDQSAAIKLAICDDIGERSYDVVDVAAILVRMLTMIPSVGMDIYILPLSTSQLQYTLTDLYSFPGVKALHNRYKIDADEHMYAFFLPHHLSIWHIF